MADHENQMSTTTDDRHPADREHAERARLDALERLAILDSPADQAFDDVVAFASKVLRVPIAAFGLIDRSRQWFKATVGLDLIETSRDIALCDHVVASNEPVVVGDTAGDDRFRFHPLVVGRARVAAYAAVPVRSAGLPIGSLCVLDHTARDFTSDDVDKLLFLARQVEHLVDLHARRAAELPPPVELVVDAADAIADGVEFTEAVRIFERPSWLYDHESLRILAVNDVAERHYGWGASEFCSKSLLDVRPPEDVPVIEAMVRNSSVRAHPDERVWRHCRADGEVIDVRVVGAPTFFAGRHAQLVVITDVSAKIVLSGALEHAAHSDSLTGLANRREFVRGLTERLETGDAASVSVSFIDLDRFKMVNDTVGHDAGDALLAAAAVRILRHAPADGIVARLGGDEFAVMHTSLERAEAVEAAEMIRAELERPFVIDGNDFYVSASIGVALAGSDATPRSLLSEADAAMYAAKENGRNAVVVFDHHLRAQMVEWSQIQRDLHRALDDGELQMFVQDVVDIRGDAPTPMGSEALVRWNHPERGLLEPGSFIGVAEESGQIVRLGQRLLSLGAAHAASSGRPVSVNVSVRQFNQFLIADVEELFDRYGLAPGELVIEVTESAIVDADHAEAILQGLRAAGAHVWIDDFGTGFSSLARLSSLTVDGLKLDRRFVGDLESQRGWGIATAIVGIARALGIIVVAEGVETRRQFELVRELGCDAAQGFLFDVPSPAR